MLAGSDWRMLACAVKHMRVAVRRVLAMQGIAFTNARMRVCKCAVFVWRGNGEAPALGGLAVAA